MRSPQSKPNTDLIGTFDFNLEGNHLESLLNQADRETSVRYGPRRNSHNPKLVSDMRDAILNLLSRLRSKETYIGSLTSQLSDTK